MSAIHWSTVLTCKNRLSFSLLPFALIPQYLKRFNWSIQWNPLTFGLFSLASIISRSFQTVRRVREAWMFGLCLFRPSRQSNIPTSVQRRAKIKYSLPRENKFPRRLYIDAWISFNPQETFGDAIDVSTLTVPGLIRERIFTHVLYCFLFSKKVAQAHSDFAPQNTSEQHKKEGSGSSLIWYVG